tara:strand:- start:2885 stop:3322 length:438 start_codon:yes stop_codon:yes gene_type:complete
MAHKSLKNRKLVWLYANHEKKEYLSGNYLIAGHQMPASPNSIIEMIGKESAVGTAMLALLTPFSLKQTGESITHPLRGRWAGCKIESINNKLNRPLYRKVESEYQSLNLDCLDYLRETISEWDAPLYEKAGEHWHLPHPKEISLF